MHWIIENEELIALLLSTMIAIFTQYLERTKRISITLMFEAEKIGADNLIDSGPEKMSYVLANVPRDARFIAKLQGKTLDELIQGWYDQALKNLPV